MLKETEHQRLANAFLDLWARNLQAWAGGQSPFVYPPKCPESADADRKEAFHDDNKAE